MTTQVSVTPGPNASQGITVGGRQYTAPLGAVVQAPDGDAYILYANGWFPVNNLPVNQGNDPIVGLTQASQTQSQVIENQPLVSGASLQLANFTSPGVMTKFHFIAATAATPSSAKGLLFTFVIDGVTVQFDGDLWGVSGVPNNNPNSSTSTPYVFESDHLCLMSLVVSGNAQLMFIFKYPVWFNTLTISVTAQSYAGASYSAIWSGADAQIGIISPRRLRTAFTNYSTPSLIPSAVEWQSNYTTGGGYAVGNLCTNANALYQCISGISGGTTVPGSDATHWSSVSTSANPNFNTGFPLLSVNQPVWLVGFSVNAQGPVNGGAYGSVNANVLSFLESNIAVYDRNLLPGDSYTGSSPGIAQGLIYNSSGTEDFMGGSFYWTTLGDVFASVPLASTPGNILNGGKKQSLRHGYIVGVASAFMNANVDLLSLTQGGIKCSQSCLMRWEEGNVVRAQSGPITPNNTWKVNPTVLYYV